MSNWNYLRISHSQKNHIDLYCRQLNDSLEIYITDGNESNVKVFVHDVLIGQLEDLYFDQNLNKINWLKKEYTFEGLPCKLDMAKVREKQLSSVDHIDYLTVHISNAINYTFSNSKFPKYLQTNIIGKWIYKDFVVEFNLKEQYKKNIGHAIINPLFLAVTNNGKYNFSENMMFLEGEGSITFRTQVVDLINNELTLPGMGNSLFFILQKEKELVRTL